MSRALNKWRAKALKADNTSCVVVLVDPLGPSKLTLLKRKRQEMLSQGETPSGCSSASQSKIAKLHTESELRSGGRSQGNKNANCSLSDSHIRVTDDSMIMPHSSRRSRLPAHSPFEEDDQANGDEDSINDSVQFFPKAPHPPHKWNLRHPMEEKRNMSLNVVSGKSSQGNGKLASQSFSHRGHQSPEDQFTSSQSFTKLLEAPKYAFTDRQHREVPNLSQHFNPNRSSFVDIEEEEEESDSTSDQGEAIPNPPPCTPCSEEQSDSENTLHSSADVTDTAFSLASDESLGTPVRSLRAAHKPTTPQSAPSKLSSAHSRKGHLSKSAKRKLARRNNMFAKPPSHPQKQTAGTSKPSDPKSKVSSASSGVISDPPSLFSISSSVELKSAWASDNSSRNKTVHSTLKVAKVSTSTSTTKDMGTSPSSPPELRSPTKRVLNTSRSMNDVATPARPKEPSKSLSCTGLTPSMGHLMSENPALHDHKPSLNTAGEDSDKTLRPSNKKLKASSEDKASYDSILNASQPSEPLKQLNKTRRWGSFFRGSKHSLEQMFHMGSHSKGSKHGAGSKKLNTTSSTGVLEGKLTASPMVARTAKTSMSASQLPDRPVVEHRHLPDITLSHFADLNSTTVTAGNLSALSAVDEDDVDYDDDSMLSLRDIGLANAHHSMLEEGVIASHRLPGRKGGKRHQKGFLQKTRFTLSRARKAAKKAFFPENNRLMKDKQVGGSGAGKRRSDEFLSTPDIKRRKPQEAEKI